MLGSLFRTAFIQQLATVLLLFLVGSIAAQPPADGAPVVENAVPDESISSQLNSRSSFKLPHQQSVIQCVELARDAILRKDYFIALPLLERALAEPNSFVPTATSTEVASHEEVRRLLRKLPLGLRQRLEVQREIAAKRVWEQTREKGNAELVEFLQEFGESSFAIQGWWRFGILERDHGRHRTAAAAFTRCAEHPKTTGNQRAVGLIACFESLIDAAQFTPARLIRQHLTELDGAVSVGLGGRSQTLSDWLNQHLPKGQEIFATGMTSDWASPISDRVNQSADWRRQRPVLAPIWKQEFRVPQSSSVDAREQLQRKQGIRPIPTVRPMIAGQQVVTRNLESIQSFDLANGRLLWTIPNLEFKQIGDVSKRVENANFQQIWLDWSQRRTNADSIFGRFTVDAQQLFAIQETDRAGEFRLGNDLAGVGRRMGPRFNRLCSYSLSTGKLAWGIGGSDTDPQDPYGGYFFLGTPLPLDGMLYVVAQKQTETQLLAIDPDQGQLKWSLLLGTTALPMSEDLQRSRVACPIVCHDGLLLCTTGAGVITAVDPLLRTLIWGFTYKATTISTGDVNRSPQPFQDIKQEEQWWDAWREPFLMRIVSPDAPAMLVFASPETDQLHAIRLPDGQPIWSVPRQGGLLVAGMTNDVVIVMEGLHLRGLDLRTGQQRWRTLVAETGGPAVLVGSTLLVPGLSGGTIVLEANTGELLADSRISEAALGVLLPTERGWLSFNSHSLMQLPRLGDIRQHVIAQLQLDPDNEALRVSAALLDLQAREPQVARERLAGLKSSPARDLRREALIAALEDLHPSGNAPNRSDLAQQLKELSDNSDYKFAAAAAIGTAALSMSDFVDTVDAGLEGLTADLAFQEGFVKRGEASIRKDRVLLGLIDEAYRRTPQVDRPNLDAVFERRVMQARSRRQPRTVDHLRQLADQWHGLDWSRRLVAVDDDRILRKRTFAEAELRLLDAAGSNDPAISSQAYEKLTERLEHQGLYPDAVQIRQRQITHELVGNLSKADHQAPRNAQDPRTTELQQRERPSPWPLTKPTEESRPDRNFEVYSPMVPTTAEPGSLLERLDLCVDRDGSKVVFRGNGFFQSGQNEDQERRLTLPTKPTSIHRGQAGYLLREAWGIGRMVILQVGSELFGILPEDERGDPNSQFLWSIPMDLQLPNGEPKNVPERAGSTDQRQILVDQLNRPLGKVGPVLPSYFCYQPGNKLVSVETETGRELWRRPDVTTEAIILGDEHHVYVWRDAQSIEILSSLDGRKQGDAPWTAPPGSLLHSRGRFVWTLTKGTSLQIELHDLLTGQLIWSRSDPKQSLCTVLDPETLVVARPDGQLMLIAARTGHLLCEPLAITFDDATRIYAWHDPERWYLALSGSVSNLSGLNKDQPNNAYRLRFFNGSLTAIDRQKPRVLWTRNLKNEPLGLDQPKASPVLVQIWKLRPPHDGASSHGMLRLIDKRTGKAVVERQDANIQTYFLLNPDPQQAILEMKLTYMTFRLQYFSEPPADADQAIKQQVLTEPSAN